MKNKLPNGVRDEIGPIAQMKERLVAEIQQYFDQRGFEKIITPVVEYQDVFEDYDVGQQKLFKLLATDGTSVVLRPDMTMPIARVISSTNLSLPIKLYYNGEIFRINKALSGAQDESTQAGAELIGYSSIKAEQECLVMMLQLGQRLNLTGLKIELGIARFADLILQTYTTDQSLIEKIKTALFQKQISTYSALISEFQQQAFFSFLSNWPRLFGQADQVLQQLSQFKFPVSIQSELAELRNLISWIQENFPNQDVQIDLSNAAPQEYYTGITFQAYSSQSSSYLFSGGRYDHLLSHFQTESVPATGLGIDVDRLVDIKMGDQTKPVPTFIYYDDQHWLEAETLLMKLQNAQLCLVDSLAEAEKIARDQQAELINLSGEVKMNG